MKGHPCPGSVYKLPFRCHYCLAQVRVCQQLFNNLSSNSHVATETCKNQQNRDKTTVFASVLPWFSLENNERFEPVPAFLYPLGYPCFKSCTLCGNNGGLSGNNGTLCGKNASYTPLIGYCGTLMCTYQSVKATLTGKTVRKRHDMYQERTGRCSQGVVP